MQPLNKEDLIAWKEELSEELESLKEKLKASRLEENKYNNRHNLVTRMGLGSHLEKHKSEFVI